MSIDPKTCEPGKAWLVKWQGETLPAFRLGGCSEEPWIAPARGWFYCRLDDDDLTVLHELTAPLSDPEILLRAADIVQVAYSHKLPDKSMDDCRDLVISPATMRRWADRLEAETAKTSERQRLIDAVKKELDNNYTYRRDDAAEIAVDVVLAEMEAGE